MKIHKDNIEQQFILSALCKDSFIETDGESFWLVNELGYNSISKNILISLIKSKEVYSKKIDDETTCYYLTPNAKEKILDKIDVFIPIKVEQPLVHEPLTPKSSVHKHTESEIKSFLNR